MQAQLQTNRFPRLFAVVLFALTAAILLGGALGSGGPKGVHNGNYKHGRYTTQATASRRWLRHQTREVRALTKRLRQL